MCVHMRTLACVRSKSRGIKQPPTGYQLISVCRDALARKINHILSLVFHFCARRMIFGGSRDHQIHQIHHTYRPQKKKDIESMPKLFSAKLRSSICFGFIALTCWS